MLMRNVSARLYAVVFLLAAQGALTVTYTAGTLPENIPDFSQDPSRPAVQSVQSGSWSSPSTWGGTVPTANHVVRIVHRPDVPDRPADGTSDSTNGTDESAHHPVSETRYSRSAAPAGDFPKQYSEFRVRT
jgi:hypothetical protein